MAALWNDVRFALRVLLKRPGFSLTVILTLGAGIGAATAIFSVVNAVLIRPLPYSDPERLVIVWGELRARNVDDWPFSFPDFADLRTHTTTFEGLAGVQTFRGAVPGPDGESVTVVNALATTNIFDVLGLRILHGRNFVDADGVPPPPPPPAAQAVQGGGRAGGPPGPQQGPPPPPPPPGKRILGYEFWQRYFGGNERVIGTVAQIGNQNVEILGVLEPGSELLFRPGTNMEPRPDVWQPFVVNFAQGNRNNVGPRVIGRLKPGVKIPQAQAEVDALAASLRKQFTTKETAGLYFHVRPIQGDLVSNVRPALLALMGAVVFLLLIACANVANLLLTRSSARERELAVRSALGAPRGSLIRQLLTESIVLAIVAAAVGVLLGQLGIRLLLMLQPADLPRLSSVAIDGNVLLFAIAVSLVSAVIFGLVPAMRSARPDVVDVLRQTGRTGGLGRSGLLRSGVVVAEVVLSFVLLIGSGLMVRSFAELHRINPGFDPENIVTFQMANFQLNGPAQAEAMVRDLRSRMLTLPGVTAASMGVPLPLDGTVANARFGPLEALANESLYGQATTHFVHPGYFETLRTPVLQGRTFTDADNRPDALYIVIDDMIAAKLFPNESPIGKRMLSRIRTPEPETFEVIGVVAHQRHTSLAEPGREGMFFAAGLANFTPGGRWAVRTERPEAFITALRAELASLPGPPIIHQVQPMTAFVDRAMSGTRFALVLIGLFAVVAAVLAAVGLYSVLSTVVRQRTAEIGVRMAFGAGRGSVFGLVVGRGMLLSGLGVVIGLVAAYVLTGAMRHMLVGVTPTDPMTFAAIALLFMAVALLACGIPAARAARLDPVTALRED